MRSMNLVNSVILNTRDSKSEFTASSIVALNAASELFHAAAFGLRLKPLEP